MHLYRKQDLAVYYFIKDLFYDVPFVTVEDGFPQTNLVVPSIAVDAKDLTRYQAELGNKIGIKPRVWFIDIFGTNKSQRDELGYTIFDAIELNNIVVYDYDEGFPPDFSPKRIGCLKPEDMKLEPVMVFSELVEKLYWRSTISFVAEYESD